MALPLSPPLPPQLARSRARLPEGENWAYEPKWDGFRCVAFVDDGEVFLQSRNGKALRRYFPELRFPPGRFVLDGEIVIFAEDGTQLFDVLGQRIHPAKSRIDRLAEETPARFVAFDLLARERRRPARAAVRASGARRWRQLVEAPVDLTPWTHDVADADPWLRGAEGVIAKELDQPYRPGERVGMVKVKRVRTIDAVVHGWRPGKEEGTVGSLILALYDGDRPARRRPHERLHREAEARARRDARSRSRRASPGWATRRGGPATASSSGASCGPSSSSRSPSTT